MSIRADLKYNGTVKPGAYAFESQKGTPGYCLRLECDDGEIDFTIWLTEKNKDGAVRDFKTLGINPEDLKSPSYIENQLAIDITGREISFKTKEEEYNGKKSIKVQWIGKKSEGVPSKSMAAFFGDAKKTEPPTPQGPDDDEGPVPF